ncbi:hypothetical protein H671_2g6125 [Cricetulus griseus]|uniref:Uncharacterized protein n=1 Tax=Cricetulus griseus TaxID=10029 RepID=A0A061IE20_CRIGR|nr:hypothetical protein H671_2g6125 [Cricetulus griseus]
MSIFDVECFIITWTSIVIMKLVFKSVYILDYIDGFSYVEPFLHPLDEAYLIVVDDFSHAFLDLICQYFIENFSINVHEGYWSVVLFLICDFVWLGF